MATFLNETFFPSSKNFKLILEYDKVMNIDDNSHDVTYYLYFQSLNGYSGSGTTNSVKGQINGVQVGAVSSIGKNQKLLLGTKTVNVPHNEDGTGSVLYSALIDTAWSSLGDASVTGKLILPKINRASTWNFTSLQMSNIEDTLVLKINKYVETYTNKVVIENLSMDEVVRTIEDVEDGYEVIFNNEELNSIYTMDDNENLTNLRFYLSLYTYDGDGNQVGTVQRTLMNAYLTNANPTFTYTIEETEQKVIDLLETNTAEYIIKNVSKPKVSVTANALKGATIKTISIVNSTQANANENPYIFENVQTGTFTIVVTDSRGLTKTEVVTKNLINYTPVYINSYLFERESQTSSNIILNADVTCYSGSFNSIANIPTIMYKVGVSGTYQEITSGFTFENNKIVFDDYILENILSYTKTDRVYLYVLDLLTEDTENEIVSKGIATFEAGEHDFQVNGELIVADENRENKKNILDIIPKKTSELTNDSGFLINGMLTNSLRVNVTSITALQEYLSSDTVPAGCGMFPASINGVGCGIFYQKTTNLYLSFIHLSYTLTKPKYYKCSNGTWTSADL